MKTDLQLQKDVMDELKWQPSIKASEIGVSVHDGIVTLSGSVNTFAEKREAERAALRVEGVRGIAEEIEVDLPMIHKKDDGELAKTAVNALRWDSMVPDERLKVKVENGWITVEGTVSWAYQRSAVGNALSNLMGVRGITNLVTVMPAISPVDVKRKILAAFERSASVDASNIHVSNIGEKVMLTGTVRSYAEKVDAQRAAWNAPGVSQVENHLEVKVPSYSEL